MTKRRRVVEAVVMVAVLAAVVAVWKLTVPSWSVCRSCSFMTAHKTSLDPFIVPHIAG